MSDNDDAGRFAGGTWVDPVAIASLRAVAVGEGVAAAWRRAPAIERRQLFGAAYAVAGPVVFERLTRGVEQRRGHWSCAISIQRLADPCRDHFYDDMEAVVKDLLAHAGAGIANLEGWIVRRLRKATVDAHRRRRGERGALQRPRLPRWLADGLARDPWLEQLAIEVLTWVGVPVTAGLSTWPLDAWTERRATATGDWSDSARSRLEADLNQVLAVMRRRPRWYADHVERPLGTKATPLVPAQRDLDRSEPRALNLVERHEAEDSRLTTLADTALQIIEARLAVEPDATGVVVSVLTTLFGRLTVSGEVAESPYAPLGADEQVEALIQDPAEVDRLVTAVLRILGREPEPSLGRGRTA